MKSILFLLNLCPWYIPDNIPMTDEMCLSYIEAKSRDIRPDKVKPEIEDFNRLVAQTRWPKK